MPARDRVETTHRSPDKRTAYRVSVHYDEWAQYRVHWSVKRNVYKPFGPNGCRGRTVLRRFHWKRKVSREEARLVAKQWHCPFRELPARLDWS